MSSRALELVRRFLARREASDLVPKQQGARRGGGILQLRYSYRSVELKGDEAHLVATEQRYQDGRFESESVEGTIDSRTAPEALRVLRQSMEDRVERLIQPLAGWFLKSPRDDRRD